MLVMFGYPLSEQVMSDIRQRLEARRPTSGETACEAVVASGNAVRKNPVLRGILSARLGRPVLVPRHVEEAACGIALMVGVSTGMWPELEKTAHCIPSARGFLCDALLL